MAAVRHLGFLKYENFYIPHGSRSLSACPCKISSRSDERLPRYCKFSISKITAVRHLWFLKYENFHLPRGLWSWSIFFMQNFVAIGWTVAEILQVFDFQKWRPSAILDFKIWKFLHSALFAVTICVSVQNFVAIGWMVAELLQFFDFSNMAAVRHIGFFVRMPGTTIEVALLVFITLQNLD